MANPETVRAEAKPAQKDEIKITTTSINARDRRDLFVAHFGAAVLQRGQGRTPIALAREVIPYVDAFIAILDGDTK